MMQNPLLGYSSFSHFLDLRHQQYTPTSGRVATSGSVSPTPPPPPPPPLFLYNHTAFRQPSALTPLNNDCSSGSPSPNNAKSFTIDAILGLRDSRHGRLQEDVGGKYANTPTDLRINATMKGSANQRSNATTERHQGAAMLHQGSNFTTCGRRNHDKSSESLHTSTNKKGGKSKRVRTIFTPEQLERLEAEFERQQYMVGPERLYLAHALQLTEAQVKVWFQNRRIKWRKQHLEMQQQRLAVIKQQQHLQQQNLNGDDMEDSDLDSNSGDDASYTTPTLNATSSNNA